MSKKHFVNQGSEQWWSLRMGKPTASNFFRIMSPRKHIYSEQHFGYRNELLVEKLLGVVTDKEVRSVWAGRGKVEQDHAAQQFAMVEEVDLQPIGFIEDDTGRIGCSPDYLIRGRNEAVEIKCVNAPDHIGYLLGGELDNYGPQVQGQLWIGGFEAVHLYVYHPSMPAMHIATRRDEGFIQKLRAHVERFLTELDAAAEMLRALGTFQHANYAGQPVTGELDGLEEIIGKTEHVEG